jgi:hypothetical protein
VGGGQLVEGLFCFGQLSGQPPGHRYRACWPAAGGLHIFRPLGHVFSQGVPASSRRALCRSGIGSAPIPACRWPFEPQCIHPPASTLPEPCPRAGKSDNFTVGSWTGAQRDGEISVTYLVSAAPVVLNINRDSRMRTTLLLEHFIGKTPLNKTRFGSPAPECFVFFDKTPLPVNNFFNRRKDCAILKSIGTCTPTFGLRGRWPRWRRNAERIDESGS